jgi:hypothetical protein
MSASLCSLLLACAAASAPAPAATVITTSSDHVLRGLSAYDGRVAWWSTDARDRGQLMSWNGSDVERAPIARVNRAFELDLGPTATGHVAAVYSRCDRHGEHCDVYQYDFTTRRQTRVGVAADPHVSETEPTLWRRRIAFVADATDAHTGRIVLTGLRGGGRHVLRGGPSSAEGLDRAQPGALDLRGSTVAFQWNRFTGPCLDPSDKEGGTHVEDIRVDAGARQYVLDRACIVDALLFSPALTTGGVTGYIHSDTRSVFRSAPLDAGPSRADVALPLGARGASFDGDQIAYLSSENDVDTVAITAG